MTSRARGRRELPGDAPMERAPLNIDRELRLSRLLMFSERKYQRFLAGVLKENGVGASDYPILLSLFHAGKAGMDALSQTEIADHNIQDKGLVTRAVRGLSGKGLVATVVDPSNRSRHLVSLTDEGEKVAARIDEAIRSWEDDLWGTFGEDEPQARAIFAKLATEYLQS